MCWADHDSSHNSLLSVTRQAHASTLFQRSIIMSTYLQEYAAMPFNNNPCDHVDSESQMGYAGDREVTACSEKGGCKTRNHGTWFPPSENLNEFCALK